MPEHPMPKHPMALDSIPVLLLLRIPTPEVSAHFSIAALRVGAELGLEQILSVDPGIELGLTESWG